MTTSLKLVVLGGGSTYSPELIFHLCRSRVLRERISKIVLYDNDPARIKVVNKFAQRVLAEEQQARFSLSMSTSPAEAFKDAHIFFNMMRPGQMPARLADEQIPLKFGLIGQETMGLGGLRLLKRQINAIKELIPAINNFAAPNPMFFNFANPAGLLSMAVGLMGDFKVLLGLCNIPFGIRLEIARVLKHQGLADQDPAEIADQVQIDSVGLNHLSFFRNFMYRGVEETKAVISFIAEPPANFNRTDIEDLSEFRDVVRSYNLFPNWYWHYRTNCAEIVQGQQALPLEQFRAAVVGAWEKQQLQVYDDESSPIQATIAELRMRGGANYALTATRALTAILSDSNDRQIVSTKNVKADGASPFIPWLPPQTFVEVPCLMRASGPRVDEKTNVMLPEPFRSSVKDEADAGILFVLGLLQNQPELVRVALELHPLIGQQLPAKDREQSLTDIQMNALG